MVCGVSHFKPVQCCWSVVYTVHASANIDGKREVEHSVVCCQYEESLLTRSCPTADKALLRAPT